MNWPFSIKKVPPPRFTAVKVVVPAAFAWLIAAIKANFISSDPNEPLNRTVLAPPGVPLSDTVGAAETSTTVCELSARFTRPPDSAVAVSVKLPRLLLIAAARTDATLSTVLPGWKTTGMNPGATPPPPVAASNSNRNVWPPWVMMICSPSSTIPRRTVSGAGITSSTGSPGLIGAGGTGNPN